MKSVQQNGWCNMTCSQLSQILQKDSVSEDMKTGFVKEDLHQNLVLILLN